MAEFESLEVKADEDLDHHIGRHMLDRLVMLSDGVFAIAVTLAAIEIKVPNSVPTLGGILDALSVELSAYLVSFMVIAVFWVTSRDLFARLKRVDNVLTALTLAMLCAVALIPASSHMMEPHRDITGSLRFYALTMTVAGSLSLAMWLYASYRDGVMHEGVPRGFLINRWVSAATVPLLFLVVLLEPTTDMLRWMVPAVLVILLLRRVVIPRILAPKHAA